MLRAIAGCVPNEGDARIICSTTHKAKGREWGYVEIDPDFLSTRPPSTRSDHQECIAAELRLLYVAVDARKVCSRPTTEPTQAFRTEPNDERGRRRFICGRGHRRQRSHFGRSTPGRCSVSVVLRVRYSMLIFNAAVDIQDRLIIPCGIGHLIREQIPVMFVTVRPNH